MSNNSSNAVKQEGHAIELGTTVNLCLLAIAGSVGNTLVVATVMRMSQLHRKVYILVGNLCTVGLLNSFITIPMHIGHMLAGAQLWEWRAHALCKVRAYINFGLILATLLNSSVIALCRYRAITTKHSMRGQTESTQAILKLICFTWALPTLVALSASPFLGYNPQVLDCFFKNANEAFWFMNVAMAIPALASTACMLIAYLLIIKKVRDSRLKIADFHHRSISRGDSSVQPSGDDKMIGAHGIDVKVNNDWISQSLKQAKISPSITVFTTEAPDEYINTPSTSYAPDEYINTPSTSYAPDSSISSNSHPEAAKRLNSLRSSILMKSDHTESMRMEDLPTPSCSHFSAPGRMSDAGKPNSTAERKDKSNKRLLKEIKLTLHLCLAFILFCLLYLPLCLMHLFHALHPLTKETWLICYTLALSFSTNAWLLYALFNQEFQQAFKALLRGQRSF